MKIYSTLAFFITFAWMVVLSSNVQSAVIERDWKEPRDGLLTFDTVNNREWLDLTQTLTINLGKRAPDGSFTYDYERDLIAELQPGGLFEGFQAATSDDVRALALSAGVTLDTNDFNQNSVPIGTLIDMIGPTWLGPVSSGANQAYVFGLTSNLIISPSNSSRNQLIQLVFVRRDDPPNPSVAGLFIDVPSDIARSNTVGAFIYRTAIPIPEPSGIFLCVFFTNALLLVSRRYSVHQTV